jgi:hypothetical protein
MRAQRVFFQGVATITMRLSDNRKAIPMPINFPPWACCMRLAGSDQKKPEPKTVIRGTRLLTTARMGKKAASFFPGFLNLFPCYRRWRMRLARVPVPVPAQTPQKSLQVRVDELSENIRKLCGGHTGVQFLVAIPRDGAEMIFRMSGVSDGVVGETKSWIVGEYSRAQSGPPEVIGEKVKAAVAEKLRMATVLLEIDEKKAKRPGRESFTVYQSDASDDSAIVHGFAIVADGKTDIH